MEDPSPPDPQQESLAPPKSSPVSRAGTIDNILRSFLPSGTDSPQAVTEGNGEGMTSKGKEVMIDSSPNPSVSHTKNTARAPSTLGKTNPSVSKYTARAPATSRQAEKGRHPVQHGRNPGGPPIARSTRTWADLFPTQPRRQPNTVLTPVELAVHEGRKFVDCDEEDLKEMDSHWGLSLVGYVIGKRPYYKPFVDFLHRLWKPKGSLEILMREGGFFIAKFSNEEDLMEVMEGGPWLMAGRAIVLRRWSRGMRMEMERLETIPIWIRFPALPLHMWGLRLISKLASAIGKPLYMDTATASRSRVAFARVCIEISAQSELPDSVLYREEGIWKDIPVEYEWKPSPCPNCSTFGHSSAQCAVTSKQQKVSGGKHIQIYVPVSKPASDPDPKPATTQWQSNNLPPVTQPLEESKQNSLNLKEHNKFSILDPDVERAFEEENKEGVPSQDLTTNALTENPKIMEVHSKEYVEDLNINDSEKVGNVQEERSKAMEQSTQDPHDDPQLVGTTNPAVPMMKSLHQSKENHHLGLLRLPKRKNHIAKSSSLNDLLVFSEGSTQSAQVLDKLFKDFHAISGLQLNAASNVPSMWASWIRLRYLRKCNIWNCRPPNGCSCAWKQIIKAHEWEGRFYLGDLLTPHQLQYLLKKESGANPHVGLKILIICGRK
ncbi:hypothetical protein QJS10_CPB04g00872 [Acorus calamus]|uniref:DUF4283 domain-containing protein n=1 Tax=Acorus calamus TaxID=4465 RepID=A0AAV9EX21_ACOCL|nr:hypothetical protein QJS10_CPB04g00872 [Acorus calamus]